MLLVDTTTAEHSVGIRVVIEGFLRALAELPERHDTLIGTGPALKVPEGLNTVRVSQVASRPLRLAYQRIALPLHVAMLRRAGKNVDRVLLLDAYLPMLRPGGERYTVFVHDLLTLTHPHYWTQPRLTVKRLALRTVRHSNATLVTSTEENAARIERLLGRCAAVSSFGCGQLTDAEADAALAAPETERQPHLLFIGSLERRKGLATLIDAFAAAAPKLDEDTKLIVIGRAADETAAQIQTRIDEAGLQRRVVMMGAVSREKALELLRTARALVYPSEAEGFGLPVLEGLALGTPVVTSNIPAIHSWAGDSVTYAEPNNRGSLTDALLAAAGGDHPPAERGMALSRSYRWEGFAQRLIEISTNPAHST
ncbi:MAG TPA: glycosyltransferase family 1 protein [Dehalococcoidia bacterium]|nr:glycosyltransferase family 1 protein [Dehalococcoidia bacterium]